MTNNKPDTQKPAAVALKSLKKTEAVEAALELIIQYLALLEPSDCMVLESSLKTMNLNLEIIKDSINGWEVIK